MFTPRISMIVAVDENRAIGKDNRLLWNIPEDLKRFKGLTTGHAVIMGENTYYSIGRPLPNRTNIVVTMNQSLELPGCLVAHSIDEAFQIAREQESEEAFVIGGASIYKQCLPLVERLYLTLVEGAHDADTFFPEYSEFTKVLGQEKSGNGEYQYTYFVLERAKKD
ncbi:MAG: dihydrofolate reductase [Candidatus Moranbacteria bacterium]|nr:dihydrofolate reductase [Candidatus Moranbacteria bacterium]